ncbi:MAG: dipeptide/oligopeptide/nickel ABC transporter permease/ATP-binding protein, partial [Anaerolineae bacterium]
MSSRFWKRLLSDPFSAAAVVYLVVLALLALLADVIAPYEPMAQDVIARYGTPSAEFWLGTDDFGRDLFSRVIYGARYAFQSLFISMGIAVFIGVPAGLLAGYSGGRLDRAITWVIDVIFTLPAIMMGFAIVAILGSGLTSAMIALGIVFSSRFARLSRGVMIAEKSELYVDGARVGGLSTARIMFRHILPNVAPSLIVQMAILSSAVLILEATFSFLGLGVNAGEPAWGRMLAEGQTRLRQHAWGVVPPGVALVTTVVAFNLLGDGIRDAIGRDSRTNQLTQTEKRDKGSLQSYSHASGAILSVRGLEVQFPSEKGPLQILKDVNFEIMPGETLGLVGESGSGKSMTALSALGLVPAPGKVTAGSVQFEGAEITTLTENELNKIRGKEIAIIFQEPWAALNPSMTVFTQLADRLRIHEGMNKQQSRDRALELLKIVQIPDPERRLDEYPHQLSGGMAQRVGIAMALSCNPKLLIADEPTTALDVTVQGQILDLLVQLQKQFGMAVLFITHDLGVIAEIADRVAVMYAGEIVETGAADGLFVQPKHPYTNALLATLPHHGRAEGKLPVIDGLVPPPSSWPS